MQTKHVTLYFNDGESLDLKVGKKFVVSTGVELVTEEILELGIDWFEQGLPVVFVRTESVHKCFYNIPFSYEL